MSAYYNENDPYAAEWLRNLVAAGHLPAGDVDDRGILEVDPTDLAGYRQVHLFAGIGGWPYALRLAGWPDDEPVWTGSCPCQSLSSAGKRRGHADERHLWPAFYRLVAERRPTTIFGEQVASRLGREWLAGVRADLEDLGYAVGAADLPAACIGFPHKRQRLFWVAYLHRDGSPGTHRTEKSDQEVNEWSLPEILTIRDRRFVELVAMDVAQRYPSYAEARSVLDGIPHRLAQLRAYGNAIVPQVAAEFVKAFLVASGRRPD